MLPGIVEAASQFDWAAKVASVEIAGEGPLHVLDGTRLIAPAERDRLDLHPCRRTDHFRHSILSGTILARGIVEEEVLRV
jgi:hypothetical protein